MVEQLQAVGVSSRPPRWEACKALLVREAWHKSWTRRNTSVCSSCEHCDKTLATVAWHGLRWVESEGQWSKRTGNDSAFDQWKKLFTKKKKERYLNNRKGRFDSQERTWTRTRGVPNIRTSMVYSVEPMGLDMAQVPHLISTCSRLHQKIGSGFPPEGKPTNAAARCLRTHCPPGCCWVCPTRSEKTRSSQAHGPLQHDPAITDFQLCNSILLHRGLYKPLWTASYLQRARPGSWRETPAPSRNFAIRAATSTLARGWSLICWGMKCKSL